jgi:hypothetical protein
MPKFEKGHPGGPGRPRKTEEQRAAEKMAKEIAGEAMERLAFWMRSDNAKASVTACSVIIDRAEGKATQPVETTDMTATVFQSEPLTDDQWEKQNGPKAKAVNGAGTNGHGNGTAH